MREPRKAFLGLGTDASMNAIHAAALALWRVIYRAQHGYDPSPEFEAEVLRLHHERETHG